MKSSTFEVTDADPVLVVDATKGRNADPVQGMMRVTAGTVLLGGSSVGGTADVGFPYTADDGVIGYSSFKGEDIYAIAPNGNDPGTVYILQSRDGLEHND